MKCIYLFISFLIISFICNVLNIRLNTNIRSKLKSKSKSKLRNKNKGKFRERSHISNSKKNGNGPLFWDINENSLGKFIKSDKTNGKYFNNKFSKK